MSDDRSRRQSAVIEEFVDALDVEDLILRYDVDFDAPMRQTTAIGLLRLAGAHTPDPSSGARGLARRVGAHWCEIVQADVSYEPLTALRLIEASRPEAERLLEELFAPGRRPAGHDAFTAYAVARWYDGVGRVRYRLGSYTAARIAFETAVGVAEDHDVWWAWPDLISNHARAAFEERGQAARQGDVAGGRDFVTPMRRTRDSIVALASAKGVALEAAPTPSAPVRHREFLRGWSNALHNMATALRQDGLVEQSLRQSRASKAVSEGLGDVYRTAQSLLNEALCAPGDPTPLFEALRDLGTTEDGRTGAGWPRGRRIALQQLAARRGGARGLSDLARLLDELEQDASGAEWRSGLDVDFYAYTLGLYSQTAARLPAESRPGDVVDRWLRMAQSVREAIALPVYKRTYSRHVRPVFLRAIGRLVTGCDHRQRSLERLLSLVEESSGRELLDMLASSAPPVFGPPAGMLPGAAAPAGDGERGRRSALGPMDEAESAEAKGLLQEREEQYEQHFLRHPLSSATHDEDIAHQLVQYTLNNPGSCVVRYFRFGGPFDPRLDGEAPPEPDSLGIMVCKDGLLTLCGPVPYPEVAALAERVLADIHTRYVPQPDTCHQVWELLIAPFWPHAERGEALTHLTLVPTDDLFAIPLHVATAPGGIDPLAARVPLSHSVSVATFVSRGRHLLKKQLMEDDDDLAALMSTDEAATGGEIAVAGWPGDHVHVAGRIPPALEGLVAGAHPADWEGLAELVATEPEFFVYAGHGTYVEREGGFGDPLLYLGTTDRLTQYDLALRVSLPRNKLTVLGACLAGQGMRSDGGDVLGFMRSLIISGAGAIGVPLWSVADGAMVATVSTLLRESRQALDSSGTGVFDVVQTLHEHYRRAVRTYTRLESRIDQMPLALYL
ncbi:CHAT domain-containing protein [Streptomyces sp. NPDC047973]|uniref:CHAT domain-containing protein n=1 Tax=Streptomyces sp. NPDC047973 TaxID=3155383 RepID=UPI0034463CA9